MNKIKCYNIYLSFVWNRNEPAHSSEILDSNSNESCSLICYHCELNDFKCN
jgi:hypothetical protein